MCKLLTPIRVLAITFLFFAAPLICAQEPDMVPPPVPSVLPPAPPDEDALPTPSEREWEPLAPKGGEDQSGGVAPIPAPETKPDTPMVPPAPPVLEPKIEGIPDPSDSDSARPEIEVWRDESVSPQEKTPQYSRLDKVLVTGNAPVTVLTQFPAWTAGKTIYVRPGRGLIIGDDDGAKTISSDGKCSISAKLADGYNRSHIVFYCEGVRTVLPIVRASLSKVQQAELGGGQ